MINSIKRIATDELPDLLTQLGIENTVVIDARGYKKFEVGHYPGSESVDLALKNTHLKLLNFLKKSSIFIYCDYGIRTQGVIEKLQNAKYKGEIYIITGDIEEWSKNGFK